MSSKNKIQSNSIWSFLTHFLEPKEPTIRSSSYAEYPQPSLASKFGQHQASNGQSSRRPKRAPAYSTLYMHGVCSSDKESVERVCSVRSLQEASASSSDSFICQPVRYRKEEHSTADKISKQDSITLYSAGGINNQFQPPDWRNQIVNTCLEKQTRFERPCNHKASLKGYTKITTRKSQQDIRCDSDKKSSNIATNSHYSIARRYSQQDFCSDYEIKPKSAIRRADSLDSIYRKCVYQIREIRKTLNRTPHRIGRVPSTPSCSSIRKNISTKKCIQKLSQHEGLDTQNIVFFLLTFTSWVIGYSLKLSLAGMTQAKKLADAWIVVSWNFWKRIYEQNRMCTGTAILVFPIFLLSGLVYGLLCVLLLANRLLLFRGPQCLFTSNNK